MSDVPFFPHSQNGKRMMMRIRVLEHENEELANVNRAGRTARLETEIALRRAFVNDLKNAHSGKCKYLDEMFVYDCDQYCTSAQSFR
ncbi:unnamed protein product [Trichobilharzia regenti]|nr:unnamed protein product [Trichobilharzia regenti]